ncbi:MAG: DNRLRE domain-containing protein [Eubacteriaceae bacterium]|nr:DNRLRE domain-containing protein [Eubacteriaceae bacterium]
MRDAQSKTFLLGNGQLQAVVYASPVHYLDEGESGAEPGQPSRGSRGSGKRGSWRQIDNTIVAAEKSTRHGSYSLKNKANFFSAHFGDTGAARGQGKRFAVLLEFGGHEFAFNPVTENGAKPKQMGQRRRKASAAPDVLFAESETVIYEEAYEGADLTYTVSESAVKEYIVINGRTGANEFQSEIYAPGAELGYGGDGCPVFAYAGGASVGIAEFFAFDANGAPAGEDQVRYTLERQGGESYMLTVTLDEGYITNPGRAFPIYLDPTIMVSNSSVPDTFVASASPNSNYNSGSVATYLRTGRDAPYGAMRSLINFPIPAGVANVTSATLRMRLYSSAGTPNVYAYRNTGPWSSGTATWNNKPAYTTASGSSKAAHSGSNWYSMTVTAIVQQWANKTATNYGFTIMDTNESNVNIWQTWYSSDALSPNKPELHITYTAAAGVPVTGVSVSDVGKHRHRGANDTDGGREPVKRDKRGSGMELEQL